MTTIRAFIAIHLPPPIRDALAETARALSVGASGGAVRWVRPEQIHLTLRFLGDTPTTKLAAVQKAMDLAVDEVSPFSLQLSGAGAFPNTRRPRVIWVGLEDSDKRLAALKSALDAQLAVAGFAPDDKPFRAHLTLGRVKDERGTPDMDWSVRVPPLVVPVESIHLIESRLRPDGPVYTERHVSKLRDSKQ